MKKPKVLFYDIETTPLLAWIWRPGEQRVNPGQIVFDGIGPRGKAFNVTDIICITYCWNDGKPAKALNWGYREQDSRNMIAAFDKLIRKADITIGKNSDRFDTKHINTQRLLNGLPPMPEWTSYTDDLEKQIRKHFNFPSNGLDYISRLLGQGGKDKMVMQDWIDICLQLNRASFVKMINYGKKDVEDTKEIWDYIANHVTPKYNYAAGSLDVVCRTCGSANVTKNGTRQSGRSVYQAYHCKDHGGYAGKRSISAKTGKLGPVS